MNVNFLYVCDHAMIQPACVYCTAAKLHNACCNVGTPIWCHPTGQKVHCIPGGMKVMEIELKLPEELFEL